MWVYPKWIWRLAARRYVTWALSVALTLLFVEHFTQEYTDILLYINTEFHIDINLSYIHPQYGVLFL